MHEIIYFSSPGLAESSRLCLEFSGISWKNTTVTWDEYMLLKENGDLPWNLLPIIKTPQGIIAESSAILRYTGTLAGMEPEDLFQRAKVDEILDVMKGWWGCFTPTFSIEDLDDKIAARKKLFELGEPMDIAMTALSSMCRESGEGWIANTPSMSIVDIKAFTDTFMLFSGQFDGLDSNMITKYPDLIKFHTRFSNIPEVKNYYSDVKEDQDQWVFKPNAFN
jgi:glutathione S-transferase